MAVTFVLPEDGQDALLDLFVGSILECQANYKILNVQFVCFITAIVQANGVLWSDWHLRNTEKGFVTMLFVTDTEISHDFVDKGWGLSQHLEMKCPVQAVAWALTVHYRWEKEALLTLPWTRMQNRWN